MRSQRDRVRTRRQLIVCVALAGWLARTAVVRGALMARLVERRYVDVGRYIDVTLPSNGVFIAGVHAGSIRYYSGRLTLNYDHLQPRWLDDAIAALQSRGLHPFIAVEADEERLFRERFGERIRSGASTGRRSPSGASRFTCASTTRPIAQDSSAANGSRRG